MREQIPIFDAHAHILSGISGIKRGVKTTAAKYGRIQHGNEQLTFLPPYFIDTAFTADTLVEMMDFAGVSKAVLLQNPVIGIINDEIRQAIEKFPDKFLGTIQVDPMGIEAIDLIRKYASEKQNTLKLEISEEWGWSGNYPGFSLVGKEMMTIWETAAKLDLRVIIDTGDIFNNGYQVENIRFVAERFPDTKILIEHLAFFRNGIGERARARRHEMLLLAKEFESIYLGFSSTAAFINDDYPCFKALELLKEAVDLVGSRKILWGSDIPSTFKRYSYRQLVDVILKHAVFLSDAEKQSILYDNALGFFENIVTWY